MILIVCVMASLIYFCFIIATIQSINVSFLKAALEEMSDIGNTTDIIFNIVNQLIASVSTAEEFKENSSIKSMVSMHDDVKTIAKNYCNTLEVVKMWSKADLYDKVISDVFNFNEVIDDVLRDRYESLIYNPVFANFMFELEDDALRKGHETFNVSERSITEKNNNVILNDLFHKSQNITRRKQNHRRKFNNLKVWQKSTNRSSEIEHTRRLYRGTKTSAWEHPFMASVHVDNTFMCGASIIARSFVITAATCLQNHPDSSKRSQIIFVRVSSDYATHEGELFKVVAVYVHPDYDVMTLKNNLAILKLEHKIRRRRRSKVRRIKFDRVPEQIPVNVDHITVLGWGAKYPNDDLYETRRLSFSQLNMYHIKDCQSLYNEKYVTLKNFCAGFISKGGGACNRDLGGPGIEDGVLMGVISFGAPVCGTPDAPTVFTKLGYYAKWIDSIIEQIETDEIVDNEKVFDDKSPNYDYFREDQTEQYISTTTPSILRIGSNKENSQEEHILKKVSKMLPLIKKIEVPKFLNDLYEGLPRKLINLFAKVSFQQVVMKADNQETFLEKLTTRAESIHVPHNISLLDTTIIPKMTEGVTELLEVHKKGLSQSNQEDVAPTEGLHELINAQVDNNSDEVSDNYENNSVASDIIEIGLSIYENSSESKNSAPNELVYFDKYRRIYQS